ncbi:STAS/SEC14 domain-containing protein [Nannocystaceae bacterium ST9]
MHFSQLSSSVDSTYEGGLEPDRAILRIEMQGFIDVAMLRERVESLVHQLDHEPPAGVLLDLLGVSGYGQGTRTLAREWLLRVQAAGVRRVALVAGSSVLRTAVAVISGGLHMQLCCFTSVELATRWLREPTPTN